MVFWDWESARHVATFEQYVKRITTCTKMTNMSSIKSKCSLDLKSHFISLLHVHWTLISRSSPVKQLFWIRGNGHISHIQMSERLSVKLLDVTLLSRPTETPVTQNTWECRQLVWGTRGFKWLNMFVFMCENDYCSSAVGCINHRNIQLTEWNWKYNRMCTITEGLCCISFFHCVPVHVSSTLLSQEQSALLFSPAVTSTFRRFT